ncbi:DUF1080 domain-containing protein [Pedobacter sp. BS3]|uniref:3-keto-disaccharide hydrolase n=1 Tax=Pedobacter sp. BS3 TaxID=2567937 RepID=UPI0011EF110B|nr:DUF1080 domain-containing protein [Pedobacter sp. BS3]TZF84586.1 DUF1080 domain-containing protein [Pedobacter sp. BS3]
MTKNIITAAVIALTVSSQVLQSCASTKPMEKNNHLKGGWVSLFDGKTTNGWHTYGSTVAKGAWKVEDGVLHLDASLNKKGEGGDLVTNEEFGDFDLKLEWKISPKGNSGIIFYVHEDPAQYKHTYNTGPEMQVLDNDGHPDGKIHKHRAGDLYDLIPCTKETVKPVGEWNQAEIISKGGKLDFYLNGTKVVSTTLWDDNWKKMVAGSKFATMPGFGTFKTGKIALQDHGNDVWYRNIMIKKL